LLGQSPSFGSDSASHQIGRYLDIAADRLGIGADAVRGLDEVLRYGAVEAGQADIEVRAQEEAGVAVVEIDLRIDRRIGRELDLLLHGGDAERAHIAGRPGDAEQVLGGRMRLWQLDIDLAVAALAIAIAAAGGVGLGAEKNFLGHGGDPLCRG
jgi:hypothetical protein